MRIINGTVRDGRIVVEGDPLPEGEKVTVLTREGDETFRVSAEEKRKLLESISQAQRGELLDGDQLLQELDEMD